MLKPLVATAALAAAAAAFAQSPPAANASREVQLIAPHLVTFSGSSANFESLVTGLTQGTPVTLTTTGADGALQIVTFMPPSTLTPVDAARALEQARQNLITGGVAAPTAQQIALALAGGSLVTPSGLPLALPGLINGTTVPIQVRTEVPLTPPPAALPPALPPGLGAPADLTALQNALAQGALTGVAMAPAEVNQALQLARALLAQQGILDPTPDQLRVALTGGPLAGPAGTVLPLRGVLQGALRHTSESPYFGTSHSPLVGTSNTPPTVSVPVGPPAVAPPAVAQPPAPIVAPAPAAIAPRFGVAR
ncbi:MAG TPA: hypothetical protein VM489_15420 [Burkholderiales bacterium]|nr:hypothetical protein [Burkholderiales bacterium]